MIRIVGFEPSTSISWLEPLIENSCAIFLSKRFRPYFKNYENKLFSLLPLDTMFEKIRHMQDQGDILVLASGDPLFFGIGRRFLKEFPKVQLSFHPALTSVQKACSHFGIPWDDMDFVSLHGKNEGSIKRLIKCILEKKQFKIAVFTDHNHSPDILAKRLIEKGISDATFFVAEDMGGDSERFQEFSIDKAATHRFHPLNLVIIQGKHNRPIGMFGLDEDEFSHEKGLITKPEVRSIILSKLCLPSKGILWDIGAGSGSVSVECSLHRPGTEIFSIEQNPKRCEHIKQNIQKFTAINVNIVNAKAPDCLKALPRPDRIFIGGGITTDGLLKTCWDFLRDEGILVASTILVESTGALVSFFEDRSISFDIIQIDVRRGKRLGAGTYLCPVSSVCVFKVCK